jgi:hypothetical protein
LKALSEDIIGAALEVSNVPGMVFLEKVYENALNIELNLRGLKTLQQAPLKIFYKSHYTPYLSTWACYRFLLINLSHHQHNSAKKCISPQLPSPVLQSRGSIQKTRDDLHTNPEDAGTPFSYWKNMCTWSIFGVITRWSDSKETVCLSWRSSFRSESNLF